MIVFHICISPNRSIVDMYCTSYIWKLIHHTSYMFPLLTRNEDAGHVSSLYVGWMDLHMIYSLSGVHHQKQVPVFCNRDFEERSAE